MNKIEFKKKSSIQFNGEILNDLLINSQLNDINKEFKDRYDIIKNNFDNLIEEIYWNNLIYDKDICDIKFKPVINNTYHLYQRKNKKYFLSIITPTEWKSNHMGKFKMNYNRKWIKL